MNRQRIPMMMAVCAAFVAALHCGCKQETKTPPAAAPQQATLVLYCGAGIRTAAEQLIQAFEANHPGITISATYAGSGRLLGQLTSSRRGDLFLPGEEFYVDLAITNGLAEATTKRKLGVFVPVILVQKGNPLNIRSIRDLVEKDLRLGLGDERAVAVGKTGMEIFRKCDIPWDKVKSKVILNTGTVNELGVAITLKTIDAAIVWDATARQFESAGDAIPIPDEQNIKAVFPIVRLVFSAHPREAQAFIEFAVSLKGREILKAAGYTVTEPDTAQ